MVSGVSEAGPPDNEKFISQINIFFFPSRTSYILWQNTKVWNKFLSLFREKRDESLILESAEFLDGSFRSRIGPLNHTYPGQSETGLRAIEDMRIYAPGVLYVCFSTGGDYNRWTYTNGYVNSPAWHMHYRVNQVRNVMVHATPRTLTNRFLPLVPR